MITSYKSPSGARKKEILFAFLVLIVLAAGTFFAGGWGKNNSIFQSDKGAGGAQLVAFEPFPESDGPMCEVTTTSAHSTLAAAMVQREEAKESGQGAGEARPSDDARTEGSRRPPLHVMRDPSAAFSGIAVDLKNNEVVVTDENNFAIMSYDRLENTPPKARMSEPKRMIQGAEAYLEFNCSLYVDPNNGDIYSVNNDTLNWLTVFNRDIRGNMPPSRKLRAPHTVFGIAVDEQNQEMLLAEQDDNAVVVFKKAARDEESPIRVLQGSKTQLADPHGIAIDPKSGMVFVTNWGSVNDRPELGDPKVKPTVFNKIPRSLWPVERQYTVAASGKILPPTITVYPKGASGNTPPLRVIQGDKTGLNWPTAVAVDSEHGEIFVANDTADAVTVYKIDADGDIAPIRVIKGPSTSVKNPTGIAYDPKHDELWVANFGSHAATVFKRTANGNAKPLRVIRSAPADAPSPMMGNPHTITYDTKREEILVSN